MAVKHCSLPLRRLSPRGIGLAEVAAVLAILFVLALILFPVFAKARPSRRSSGNPHLKQVALALLSYAQDYDNRFPPVSGYSATVAAGSEVRTPVEVSWGPGRTVGEEGVAPGLLAPYVNSDRLFRGTPKGCRGFLGRTTYTMPAKTLGFMYNDLLATEHAGRVTQPAQTVLAADGEDQYWNAGHAWVPEAGPFPAKTNGDGKCRPGEGATVRNAPLRYSDGANYAFADGHIKWFKAVTIAGRPHPDVFFPPRSSAATEADPAAGEPVPAGNMQGYAATFHLR